MATVALEFMRLNSIYIPLSITGFGMRTPLLIMAPTANSWLLIPRLRKLSP